jgi:hypothetical protein
VCFVPGEHGQAAGESLRDQQVRALDSWLGARQKCIYRALGGNDLGEALGVAKDVLRMSQLVSQHLRVSLDLGETLEADEGIDRVRSGTHPGAFDVQGTEPDDRDVAEARRIDALDMEHPDLPRGHLGWGDHLDVKDVSGGSGPFPQPSQRGRPRLSGWVGRRHDLLDGAPDAELSLR